MISKETPFDIDIPFIERFEKVFQYQSRYCTVYKEFLKNLGYPSTSKFKPDNIPLLPISAFKHRDILCDGQSVSLTFKSSGTSDMVRSTHLVSDPDIYRVAIEREFNKFFPLDQYSLICYMPGYRDNQNSSLIWMAQTLIKKDPDRLSNFLPDKKNDILNSIQKIQSKGKKIILFGAAFGLLDLIDQKKFPTVSQLELLETGGMKTHRREMSKSELRKRLSTGFQINPDAIHSEYGMCEILSQMYAMGGEWFTHPDWVYVSIRNHLNPEVECSPGEEGRIGIIDLANLHSCSFILTDDRGVMNNQGLFKVLGRWNQSNPRGCNFMIDD